MKIPLVSVILRYASGLRFRQLFLLTGTLFLLDLLIPDLVPFIDELLLGLATLLLSLPKRRDHQEQHERSDDDRSSG